MTQIPTPIPALTPVADLLGGYAVGRDQIVDSAGVPAIGEVADAPSANTLLGRLKAVWTVLTSLLGENVAFKGRVALAVGAADAAPGRAVEIACSGAGNVVLKLADGSTTTIPVVQGLTILPYAVKGYTLPSSGPATATLGNLL